MEISAASPFFQYFLICVGEKTRDYDLQSVRYPVSQGFWLEFVKQEDKITEGGEDKK